MNKRLALIYLSLLRRPLSGLQSLQWVTEGEVARFLRAGSPNLSIERTSSRIRSKRLEMIEALLPKFIRRGYVVRLLNFAYESKSWLCGLIQIGRAEKHIDLWVTKTE
jgi:hypothetical protein